jgi:conjugative transfer signal peptidase TraF
MQVNIRRAKTVFTIIFAPLLFFSTAYSLGYRYTNTTSLPRGVYRLTHSPSDPLVSFCLTGSAAHDSIVRQYRDTSRLCPDRYQPLLKPVVARAGDTVRIDDKGITVNGKLLQNSQASLLDAQRRPMHPWPHGTYTVAPGTIWVVSGYNPLSYDSRYFGPIPISSLLGYAHPVWQF